MNETKQGPLKTNWLKKFLLFGCAVLIGMVFCGISLYKKWTQPVSEIVFQQYFDTPLGAVRNLAGRHIEWMGYQRVIRFSSISRLRLKEESNYVIPTNAGWVESNVLSIIENQFPEDRGTIRNSVDSVRCHKQPEEKGLKYDCLLSHSPSGTYYFVNVWAY